MKIVAEVKVANGASRKITCCDPNLPTPVNGSCTCEFLNNCSTDAMIAVLERMDALLGKRRAGAHAKLRQGRRSRDGWQRRRRAHLVGAPLNDVGRTITAVAACYWLGGGDGVDRFQGYREDS